MELTQHPAFLSLLSTLLCLYPLARVFSRSGRSPWLALLLLPNIALPFVGYSLAGAAFLFLKPRRSSHAPA